SPNEERQYRYELEMMRAREQQQQHYPQEAVYRASGSSSNYPSQSGAPLPLGPSEPGPRAETAIDGPTPSLDGFSRVENGKRYRLVVVQHPSRARMCGFGDKDRRPLSPTLIVKLIITDEETGNEVNPLDVNTSLFLLATDLCHPDDLTLAPRNILVHHQASTLPTSSTGSYAQGIGRPLDGYRHAGAGAGHAGYPDDAGSVDQDWRMQAEGQPRYTGGQPVPTTGNPTSSLSSYDRSGHGQQGPGSSMQYGGTFMAGQAESYTRNLVGAAVASASVLKDEQDKWCIFFVFQDISVRTEGVYRIKLMFVNLELNGRVGTGVSEALAECYTDPFTVYSPRRFPGMLDPTPLSRKLASQGIKIPVRNDKKKQRRRNDDGEVGEYDGGSGGDDDDD
ncbi:hypothetical protein BCV70DRAFT_147926, partial [Testicularia cyperi]